MRRKERYLVIFFTVMFICLLAGCESKGNIVETERTLTGFEGIIADSSADINVYPGRDYKVIVITEENNQNNIVTEVRGNILYIESKGHAATIHTIHENFTCYEQLAGLMKRLPGNFEYSHKSYLINFDKIKRIEKNKLILLNGIEIPVSKNKHTELKRLYFTYIGNSL